MMKKICIIIATCALLTACGKHTDAPEESTESIVDTNTIVNITATQEPATSTPAPDFESEGTIYTDTAVGEVVGDRDTTVKSELSDEEMSAVISDFKDYCDHSNGYMFAGTFDEIVDSIPTHMGYTNYEVLCVVEHTERYPFRVIIVRFDDYMTYVATESEQDGILFVEVPDNVEDFQQYLFVPSSVANVIPPNVILN